jgi:hypothetical protein
MPLSSSLGKDDFSGKAPTTVLLILHYSIVTSIVYGGTDNFFEVGNAPWVVPLPAPTGERTPCRRHRPSLSSSYPSLPLLEVTATMASDEGGGSARGGGIVWSSNLPTRSRRSWRNGYTGWTTMCQKRQWMSMHGSFVLTNNWEILG